MERRLTHSAGACRRDNQGPTEEMMSKPRICADCCEERTDTQLVCVGIGAYIELCPDCLQRRQEENANEGTATEGDET